MSEQNQPIEVSNLPSDGESGGVALVSFWLPDVQGDRDTGAIKMTVRRVDEIAALDAALNLVAYAETRGLLLAPPKFAPPETGNGQTQAQGYAPQSAPTSAPAMQASGGWEQVTGLKCVAYNGKNGGPGGRFLSVITVEHPSGASCFPPKKQGQGKFPPVNLNQMTPGQVYGPVADPNFSYVITEPTEKTDKQGNPYMNVIAWGNGLD